MYRPKGGLCLTGYRDKPGMMQICYCGAQIKQDALNEVMRIVRD